MMRLSGESCPRSSRSEAADAFIRYYEKLGYDAIPGSSLLDPAVPMAFVMSAGLAQVESSVNAFGGGNGKRYTLIQNCFRYFDLKNIGNSPYHLSLFQMPGAFTFGRHRKKSDIEQTFRLLTDVYKFSAQDLWATYFKGDVVADIELLADSESCNAWVGVGVPENQVIGLGAAHNFWKQNANFVGENHAAKCGPNTEIFFDRGLHLKCGPNCMPPCGCGRFVEISNTLFITLHIDENSRAVFPLDEPFTETVVGAERVAMLLQGASSVFDIDRMAPIVEFVRDQAINDSDEWRKEDGAQTHFQVIADHIRAVLFLTSDGAPPPGKGGRARLMRKLIREMMTSQKLLGINGKSFMPGLIDVVIDLYSKELPRMAAHRKKALEYIVNEGDCFDKTLDRGFRRLERLMENKSDGKISGREILLFEKDCGVPVPLLERDLERMKLQFDSQEYLSAYRKWEARLVESN
jgi:alanyl-tRNA synthetase